MRGLEKTLLAGELIAHLVVRFVVGYFLGLNVSLRLGGVGVIIGGYLFRLKLGDLAQRECGESLAFSFKLFQADVILGVDD